MIINSRISKRRKNCNIYHEVRKARYYNQYFRFKVHSWSWFMVVRYELAVLLTSCKSPIGIRTTVNWPAGIRWLWFNNGEHCSIHSTFPHLLVTHRVNYDCCRVVNNVAKLKVTYNFTLKIGFISGELLFITSTIIDKNIDIVSTQVPFSWTIIIDFTMEIKPIGVIHYKLHLVQNNKSRIFEVINIENGNLLFTEFILKLSLFLVI